MRVTHVRAIAARRPPVRGCIGAAGAVLLAVTGLFAATVSHAQGAADVPAAEITAALIESRLEQVQASAAYDDETKTAATELYRRALANLEAAAAHRQASARFEQARVSAPRQTEEIRRSLAAAVGRDPLAGLDVGEDAPAREIEQRLQQERAVVAAAQARLAELEQSLAAAQARPQAVRQRQAAVAQEARDVAARMTQAAPPGESDIVTEARAWARQSAARALGEEARRLDQELLSQPMRVELLEAQRDESRRTLEVAQARVRELQSALGERRRSETARVIAEIGAGELGEAADHALARELLEGNLALAEELEELTRRLEQLTADDERARARLQSLQRRFQNARQKLEVAGVSPAMGRYLGEERRDLPALADYRRDSREREERIAEAGLRDIRLEEALQQYRDVEARVEELLQDVPPAAAATLRGPLGRLAGVRQDLLRQLAEVNDDYIRLLSEYEYTESQLYRLVQEYRDFLSERLMWVRNRPMLGPAGLLALPGELAAVLAPGQWVDSAEVFLLRLTRSPLQMLAVLVLLIFWWRLGVLRAALRASAAKVGKPSEDTFASTLRAFGITLVMTLPWPLFTGVTGYELSVSWQATPASRAVGTALLQITPLLFFLRAFRILCTPGGVAEGHFRWAPEGLARLRRQMDQLMVTLLVPGFVLVAATGLQQPAAVGALIQVVFLLLIGGLMVFLYRLLVPRRGILRALQRHGGDEPVLSWPWFWLLLSLALPAALGLMALAGFLYSAGTLLGKLINTLWLVFGLVLLRELVVRWLLVMRRRLLLREALQRRDAARMAREAEGSVPAASDESAAVAGDTPLDIGSLDTDTRKLVNVALAVTAFLGFGGIWSGLLPALGAFSDITLWQSVQQVGAEERIRAVTLMDILAAALAVLLTVVGARTVPSLLEIVLRQRPSVTPGSRLAFATLARYSIAGIGLTFVLATIGVDWSKLQWLVAALGVGIGFGLQEIVANFISGLIILMERPVRVGDIVTVGDTSGAVTRVQIRATTIRTWDRQELLVPNKEFITGRVLNWSLSDEIIRIYFMVGVAYGSDVEKALVLIEEAAREHPKVLDDPAPLVTFESFGDNSLNLGLRCFVPALDVRLETSTDLHRAINRKFNEAGIVIAFPQRDVHLDTTSPLEIKLMRGADAPAAD